MKGYLSGWRISWSNVTDDGWKVLGPEGALALPVVPEGRRVLRCVQGQVLQDLALFRRRPMNAKNILRSWISKREKDKFEFEYFFFIIELMF